MKQRGKSGDEVRMAACDLRFAGDSQRIEGLDTLTNLKQLWLGKNKITEIEGVERLTQLEKLDVQVRQDTSRARTLRIRTRHPPGPIPLSFSVNHQSNRLTRISGIRALVNLEELYLSHNGIAVVEDVDTLVGGDGTDANESLSRAGLSNRTKRILATALSS